MENKGIRFLNLYTHSLSRVFSLSYTCDIYTQRQKYFWMPATHRIAPCLLPTAFKIEGLVSAYLSHSISFYPYSLQANWPFFLFSSSLGTESFAASGPLHMPLPMPLPLENSSVFSLLPHYHFWKGTFHENSIQGKSHFLPLNYGPWLHTILFHFFNNTIKS